jgi:alpha-aminoadipic semialdehyde synthase
MDTNLICKQDMMLLHHEVEVEYPNSQITEKHTATLLEFGKIADGKTTTAMALTVGYSSCYWSSGTFPPFFVL